ncbi:MAG: helix-turn-helix domain-containing protein [Ruminococcaceae bacterium]|nr:helix-turn-helix domain-containing protein [Oscillospiraceae bacterium]
MSKMFSENFKSMRKQLGLTQEQISENLGVSCQAISKWETNSSYPDISLLPIIADYFGVSVDYLIGHDTSKQIEEINKVCLSADNLFTENRYMEAIPILREMLIKHPANEKLMYKLAWALSGTKKVSEDNYEEAIILYHKILEISTDTEMRNRVSRDLMYRYYTNGENDKALDCVKKLPAFELCYEYNLGRSNLLEGKQLSEYLQANIQLFGGAILECLEYFECERILTEEEKKPYSTEIAQRKIALLKEILG